MIKNSKTYRKGTYGYTCICVVFVKKYVSFLNNCL